MLAVSISSVLFEHNLMIFVLSFGFGIYQVISKVKIFLWNHSQYSCMVMQDHLFIFINVAQYVCQACVAQIFGLSHFCSRLRNEFSRYLFVDKWCKQDMIALVLLLVFIRLSFCSVFIFCFIFGLRLSLMSVTNTTVPNFPN